jgi:capsular polysaccharide biosynthesis protein
MTASAQITDAPPALPDQNGQTIHGIFEPPSGFVLSAIKRNKLIVLAVAVILAVAGAAVGVKRTSTYTAAATLQVGQVNPNSAGFNGYVQSATALAAVFSRAIAAEPVLATIQHKLKLAPAKATKLLSAEPLPLAPAFRVIATGQSEAAATQLANTAAGAVIAYESQANSANPEAASLLREYRKVSVKLQQITAKIENIELFYRQRGKSKTELLSSDALASAEAEKEATAAKLRAIGAAYTGAIISQAPRTGLVSLLAGATSASNDRNSKIELFGFIGLLVGVIVGCGAAVVRERLRIRRRLAAMEAEMQRPTPA